MKVGNLVKLYGQTLAYVTSVHKKGKRLGVAYADGSKTTFVNASAAALVAQ